MARKTIKIDLFDGKSLQRAIKQIEAYRDDLPRKCQEICRILAEEGVRVANSALSEGKEEGYTPSTKVSYEIDANGKVMRAKRIL